MPPPPGLEHGLFRIYERLLSAAAGRPGADRDADVRVRASALRRGRRLRRAATGVTTCLAVGALLTVACIVAGHALFIGPGAGACLAARIDGRVAEMPDVVVVRDGRVVSNNATAPRDEGGRPVVLPPDVVLRLFVVGSDSNSTDDSNSDATSDTATMDIISSTVAKYEFARKASYLALDMHERTVHAVGVVNVTLGPSCLGAPTWIATLAGIDTVVINQLLWALGTGGMLQNQDTDEIWSWSNDQVMSYGSARRGLFQSLLRVAAGALMTILAFFLISGVTAALIRILLISGVVLVFPVVLAVLRCGPGSTRIGTAIIAQAYPWIGFPMEELRSSGRSVWAFVLAHAAHLFVYWTIYSACQSAWSYWFYPKSIPAGLHSALFGIFMVVEYFTMVFVRSKLTIRHFPRIIAAYFVLYQSYFYATLYGFYWQSMQLFFLLCAHSMVWFLLKVEVPSFHAQEISEDRPRAYVVRLGEPRWSGSAPPMTSLFHAVTENLVDAPRSFAELQEGVDGGGGGGGEVEVEDDPIAQGGISALLEMAGVSFNPSTYGYSETLPTTGQQQEEEEEEDGLRRRRGQDSRMSVSAGESKFTLPYSDESYGHSVDVRIGISSSSGSGSSVSDSDSESSLTVEEETKSFLT